MYDMHLNTEVEALFTLCWESSAARHTDRLFAPRLNFWRDILPPPLRERMLPLFSQEPAEITFHPATHDAVGRFKEAAPIPNCDISPKKGRFYPKGILSGLANVFRDNITPFRYMDEKNGKWIVDLGHPMDGRQYTFSAAIGNIRQKVHERGGTANDWLEAALDGPGMQARMDGTPTDFFSGNAFSRQDETDDRRFYEKPRMVHHLDRQARETITELHGTLLPPGGRVLDLMSSWVSHLPETISYASVSGLGMNAQELSANPRLTDFTVRDLNENPVLPFEDEAFDAAVCTASIEYLVQPTALFAEVARVLRPGGRFIVSFSDRWFPGKTIAIWPRLHAFERMGMVSELFLLSGRFRGIETFSDRGRIRPFDDKYFPELPLSDPVFAVHGVRS